MGQGGLDEAGRRLDRVGVGGQRLQEPPQLRQPGVGFGVDAKVGLDGAAVVAVEAVQQITEQGVVVHLTLRKRRPVRSSTLAA